MARQICKTEDALGKAGSTYIINFKSSDTLDFRPKFSKILFKNKCNRKIFDPQFFRHKLKIFQT